MSLFKTVSRFALLGMLAMGATACASVTTLPSENQPMHQGPAAQVIDMKTPYDEMLQCFADELPRNVPMLTMAVGHIGDETGKVDVGAGGNGAFVTQGAGDMVQSALMQTGRVKIVNRRDPRVMQLEHQMGMSKAAWVPADYHITGSINSLDFIPGGGIDVTVSGVGPKYRQYRMIVGLDLFLTHTATSQVVSGASIQKQIVADDMGLGIGRFFGDTLVAIDLGQQRREAVHFALRGMLKLATVEMLEKAYRQTGKYTGNCRAEIEQAREAERQQMAAVAQDDLAEE